MGHVFLCRRGALRDLSKSGGDVKQVFHTVAHLARQQFVGFLRLLPLRDIEEDAEHESIGDIRIVALATSGNPTNVVTGQNSKINFVGADHGARSRDRRRRA